MMKKIFNLRLQKHLLKKILATTRETSNTPNTETALSYQINMETQRCQYTSPIIKWSIVTKELSKTN